MCYYKPTSTKRGLSMEEIWKKYNSKYEVSNLGRVRHIKHQRILTYNYPKNGTPQVKLSSKSVCISHLVAGLFLGERPEGHDIHHKDHNPSNNVVTNLEYKNKSKHISEHLRKYPRGFCVICGKEIRSRLKTCSPECFHKMNWTERSCKFCGKIFWVRNCEIKAGIKEHRYKNGRGIYCSNVCKAKGNENFRKSKPYSRRQRPMPHIISTTPADQSIAQSSWGENSSTVGVPSITTSQASELRSASNLIAV
jgi:predicted nucleic acid-binding Zn ribbon protein